MMRATSHSDAVARIVRTLDPVTLAPVIPPPTPTAPVSPPCVLIATPEAEGRVDAAGRTRAYRTQLLVIGGDTSGRGLLDLLDEVCDVLTAASVPFTTQRSQYAPPGVPAPLPAQLIRMD